MANIRNLKKDIDYLTGQVVIDCLQTIYLSDIENKEPVYEIIGDILFLRDELRKRANKPGENAKSVCMQIGKDLVEKCDESYTRLNKFFSKKS